MKPAWNRIFSLAEVEQFISQEAVSNQQLLAVFDMDLTLTMPRLPVFIYLTIPSYRDKLQRLLIPLSEANKRRVLTLGLQVSEQQLVEPAAPSIIQGIQAQDIKTIVLTASLTGQVNDEMPMELQRFQKLSELGIVLEHSYPQQKILLDDLPIYNANCPVYYRGILCANGAPGTNIKGPVLVSFLAHVNYQPKTVMMVDDKVENLHHVYQSLAELDSSIRFIGLEYVGAQKHLPQQISADDFMAYWQGLINQVLNKN